MKKTNLIIAFFIGVMLFSCRKQAELIMPAENTSEYQVESADISSVSGSTILDSYGPYGSLQGYGFNIVPPTRTRILDIEITASPSTGVTALLVKYSNLKSYLVGDKNLNDDVFHVSHHFAQDEYIKSVEGRSGTFLNSLTIVTNKTSFGVGNQGGTPFSAKAPAGTWILGFWGRVKKR